MTPGEEPPSWCPDGWQRRSFTHRDHEHAFYVVDSRKEPAPAVLLLHEFPGIGPEIVELAEGLARNFRVVVPSIFGRDGAATAVDSLKQICVRREVHILARHGVSSSAAWLRDFADEHVAQGGRESYGVIGMCFTGNFALALAVDPRVKAAVVAQPSIPVWPRALGLSPENVRALQEREDLQVQGYRFRGDCMSPGAKLKAAKHVLGASTMEVIPLARPDWRAHSTLTRKYRDQDAIERVRDFLIRNLQPSSDNG